jgi:hypothetical protein
MAGDQREKWYAHAGEQNCEISYHLHSAWKKRIWTTKEEME